MARFDVFRASEGDGRLLDVQADHLDGLPSRVVVPLLPVTPALPPLRDLNPVLRIGGQDLAMMTHYLAAVPKRALGPVVGSAADQRDSITRALDLLLTGF
jgi:toxin CcdB